MNITINILNIINSLICAFTYKNYLHIYQLKDYNNIRYIKFFKLKLFIIIFNVFSILFIILLKNQLKIAIILLNIVINCIFNLKLIKNSKTPIKYTNKIKRLYIISILFIIFCTFFIKINLILNIFIIFTPIFANILNIYDKIKNFYFIKKASKKLKTSKTKVIAITGSNGKTSVKNILAKMLSCKYRVQASPKSYNTPLGLSLFINNNLKPDTDFIILEYGARHKNDIKKPCKIFGADYGIITTISNQHMESFKTIENVVSAKSELSKFLKNKLCIFNNDNKYCEDLHNKKPGKKLSVSTQKKSSIYATNICVKNFKTQFILHLKNKTFQCTTNLLGEHNITNILLSCTMAKYLKIKTKDIINVIENLTPTPHRLEYIKSHINILDDSYNCSLESATNAIKVLNCCTNKKMIVTPGIIEGGKDQYNINFELGKLCKNIDYIIIVGNTNKKAILDGLKSLKINNNIFCENSLESAKQHFSKLSSDDTLLLLNDLPDDYN